MYLVGNRDLHFIAGGNSRQLYKFFAPGSEEESNENVGILLHTLVLKNMLSYLAKTFALHRYLTYNGKQLLSIQNFNFSSF